MIIRIPETHPAVAGVGHQALEFWGMFMMFSNNFKLKSLIIVFISCYLFLIACPPPQTRLNLKVGNNLYFNEILIKTDTAQYKLYAKSDYWIRWGYTSVSLYVKIKESDSHNEKYCEDLLSWESNKFMLRYITPGRDCGYEFQYKHKAFAEMDSTEFNDYLENTYLKIKVPISSGKYDEIEVVFDKQKLRKIYEKEIRKR